jgi:pimeloyl-ACP methyl ester carboxylesterase
MACPPWMWRQLFKACGQDLTGFLPHIDTPCLLVNGESDIMTYSEQSRLMMLGQKVGVMPDKVSFKDYGHMLAWEATDSLTSLMSRFANSVVCGRAPEGGDGGAGGEVGRVEA